MLVYTNHIDQVHTEVVVCIVHLILTTSYAITVRMRQGSGLVHKGFSHKLTAADTLESEVSHCTLQALDCAAYLESEVSHWGLWLRLWLLIYITETLSTMAM